MDNTPSQGMTGPLARRDVMHRIVKSVLVRVPRPLLVPHAPREVPAMMLTVQVLGCKNLAVKKRGVLRNPFVVASVANRKSSTPVSKQTVNPVYHPKGSTFNFPIYARDHFETLKLVVWDKEFLSNGYIGEAEILMRDILERYETGTSKEGDYGLCAEPDNETFHVGLTSIKEPVISAGSLYINLGVGLNQSPEILINEASETAIHRVFAESSKKAPQFRAPVAELERHHRGVDSEMISNGGEEDGDFSFRNAYNLKEFELLARQFMY